MPRPLVYRGVLYMVKNGGIVTRFDPEIGEVVKQARAKGRGNYYALHDFGEPIGNPRRRDLSEDRERTLLIRTAPVSE